MSGPDYAVVVPTVGRPALQDLLGGLAAQEVRPREVVVVDDRPAGDPLDLAAHDLPRLRVLRSGGRGPAAARNTGWRAVGAPWVAFLDDDVVLPADWSRHLAEDLAEHAGTGGVSGRIVVPRPSGRRPTDAERGTIALETAHWATADMAYRRAALVAVGGFDERFPRAYREDADLALRVRDAGWPVARGARHVVHPVKTGDAWASVRSQRGNADDALFRRLHGARWRERAQTGRGALRRHAATTAAGAAALGLLAAGRRRESLAAGLVWAGLTARFAVPRVTAGPPTAAETGAMLLTSVAIPPVAVAQRLRGAWRHRAQEPWRGVAAVLFDRDGTLVVDVPYNGDPALVQPVDDAAKAVQRLRENGIAVGVVTNQSAIGRGLITADDERACAARVAQLVGAFDTWQVCPHTAQDGCGCRKPAPGLVLRAAAELGVHPGQVVVVGDIGADVGAARAAGARAVLVPTPATRADEVADAPVVAATLSEAVDLVLGGGV